MSCRKEQLWPYIREFSDNALTYVVTTMARLAAAGEACELYDIHGHYADAGVSCTPQSMMLSQLGPVLCHGWQQGISVFVKACCRCMPGVCCMKVIVQAAQPAPALVAAACRVAAARFCQQICTATMLHPRTYPFDSSTVTCSVAAVSSLSGGQPAACRRLLR
jgi:hypothetical protein